MSWVTVIWSMVASACLTLAVVPLLAWCQRRSAWGDLLFSLTAASTAALAFCELWMMRAQTPGEFAAALRWLHLPTWLVILTLAGFVRVRLRAGRLWLAWTLCTLRTVSLLLNFAVGQNLNYIEVRSLRFIPFLGESVAVANGVSNPWMLLGQLSLWMLVAFVADATFTVWRRGDRRLALGTGASILVFVLLGTMQAVLVFWQVVSLPLTASLFFMGFVVATAWEMSRETLHAAQLSNDLRESEARYRGIFDGAIEGIYRTSSGGKIMVANPALAKMLGYDSAADLVSAVEDSARQVWADPDERSRYLVLLDEHGTIHGYECRFKRRDGNPIWVSLSSRAVRGRDGRTTGIEGFIEDITERRRAEEAARKSAEQCSSVLVSMTEGMVMQDADGGIVACNARAEGILGLPADEMKGKTPAGLPLRIVREDGSPLPPEAHPAMVALRTGQAHTDVVLGVHRPDGTLVWLSINAQPLLHPGGAKPYAAVTTFSDISRRRKIELDAARLHHELARVSRVTTVGELVASLAHELNQPLTAIQSNAQAAQRLLARDPPDIREIKEILADVVADDQRAGELVQRVRALIQKAEVDRKRIDINSVIREVLGFLRTDAVAKGATIFPELSTGPLPVRGDRIQLQQVLLNLILNAFDAMRTVPAGQRALTVRSRRSESGGVLVAVQDCGEGIAPAAMDRLFEPFFTSKPDGLGMGLAICRAIIQAHGGRIWAENNPGRGASFHVEIPAEAEERATARGEVADA